MRDLSKWLHTCLFLGVFFLSVFLANTAFADEELSISETAQKYLGVPYLTDSQEPNQGFSTGGLIQYVFKEAKDVDLPLYPREQFKLGKDVNKEDLKAGDLVFFKGANTENVTSVGIYNGNNEIIISSVSKGVIKTELTEGSYYEDRYIGAKRLDADNLYQVESPLLKEAMKYVGVGYSSNGKTPDEGFSSAGFVQYVFEHALHLKLPDNSSEQWSLGQTISKENLQPGDVLFFKNTDTGDITTTAFYLGNGQMIYSSPSEGITAIDFEDSSYWNSRFYGAKRITEVPDIDRENPLITEALKYMGVPYVEGGKTPNGFDCSGFTKYVYEKAMGIYLPEAPEQQWELGTPVEKKDIQVGDLVFFQDTHRPGISHVGIYAGHNQMIHASRTDTAEVRINYLSYNFYTEKFAGIRRMNTLVIPKNIPVVKEATDLLNVPYQSGGTSPEGFDTGGFVQYVYKQVGIDLPRYGKDMLQKGTEVKEEDLQPGDLIFFESNSMIPAIYVGNGQIAVVSKNEGVRIVNYKVSSYWKSIYYGARRINIGE
ncbi:gamma-glutamyl hydrolase [Priestia megaterium]|nr:gamma-glutamyl hydrolase [Priestia megaterium]PEE78912.1 gamma-glutamyl hydrolase [Priestia megaterium]PFI88132.1 gamma-glutamyl hydrolase [Priestia megaterium]PGR04007.1 gamma-glutamyl hydrolase [Priestia megaterium]